MYVCMYIYIYIYSLYIYIIYYYCICVLIILCNIKYIRRTSQTIKGLEVALLSMRAGSRATVIIGVCVCVCVFARARACSVRPCVGDRVMARETDIYHIIYSARIRVRKQGAC